jgi:putative endonuclease
VDGTLYSGYARELEKRIALHNRGKGAKYTRSRRPVTLVYSKVHQSKSEAMKAEYRLKKLSRQNKEFLITNERTCRKN